MSEATVERILNGGPMKTASENRIWDALDKELVKLLRVRDDAFYYPSIISWDAPFDYGNAHFRAIEKVAGKTLEIYIRVWRLQGNSVTVEFEKTIYKCCVV